MKIVQEFRNGDLWRITRPCCKARGDLVRPAASVYIPHKPTCRYYTPRKH